MTLPCRPSFHIDRAQYRSRGTCCIHVVFRVCTCTCLPPAPEHRSQSNPRRFTRACSNDVFHAYRLVQLGQEPCRGCVCKRHSTTCTRSYYTWIRTTTTRLNSSHIFTTATRPSLRVRSSPLRLGQGVPSDPRSARVARSPVFLELALRTLHVLFVALAVGLSHSVSRCRFGLLHTRSSCVGGHR